MCVDMCVRERERNRERDRGRETERDRDREIDRESMLIFVHSIFHTFTLKSAVSCKNSGDSFFKSCKDI